VSEVITSCRTIVGFATDYLEDALPLDLRVEYERHVALCPPCRGYLAQMRALLRTAGSLPEEELTPELRTALLEEFASWQSALHP
jgi:predicted anti-sigma-YlaC factor YlaD